MPRRRRAAGQDVRTALGPFYVPSCTSAKSRNDGDLRRISPMGYRPRPMDSRYAAAALAVSSVLVLAACKAEIEAGPIGSHLDSPAGIAVLGSSHLLVTNANFQLRYSGGSLAVI